MGKNPHRTLPREYQCRIHFIILNKQEWTTDRFRWIQNKIKEWRRMDYLNQK